MRGRARPRYDKYLIFGGHFVQSVVRKKYNYIGIVVIRPENLKKILHCNLKQWKGLLREHDLFVDYITRPSQTEELRAEACASRLPYRFSHTCV